MHIYAFGSICRGDIQRDSDIDLLALADGFCDQLDISKFSIYSYNRIAELWSEGNPFAWHLHLESRMVFSSDTTDYITNLGSPSPYSKCYPDCNKFNLIIKDAADSLTEIKTTCTFDLSTIFLGIRNVATCFSLGYLGTPRFSRYSALQIGRYSINISSATFKILEQARVLCTRGYGPCLTEKDILSAISDMPMVLEWAEHLVCISEQL